MLRDVVNSALQNRNVVMFITAVLFMCGILAYFHDTAFLCAVIFTVLSVIFIIKNIIPLKYILFWVVIFYLGFFNAYFRINTTDMLVQEAGKKVTLSGEIVSIPNSSDNIKTKFFFEVKNLDGKSVHGKTFVTINDDNGDFNNFQTGDSYEMKGTLKTPFKAGNPSQFDYGKYLKNFDTFTVFYSQKQDCKRLQEKLTVKRRFLKNLNMLRDKILKEHSKYIKSPNSEILGGIVFGDDAVAPPDYIKNSFKNSGLLHILAASGMNVAFIYGFWVFFMRRIKAPFKFSVISGMVLVILYTLMTGLGPSIIRAALMLLLILFGKLIDRDAHSVSLLALVAMLMLIYNPAFINDVGFQLSFIVTFGLLTTANVLSKTVSEMKVPNWLASAVLIPVVAQVWVIPVQMFYFNTISAFSVFANILSMPFLSVVSFVGFLSSILAIFVPFTTKICMVLDYVLNIVLNVIVFLSNFFSELPFSLITCTHPNVIQIIVYYSLILILTYSVKSGFTKQVKTSLITLSAILLLSMISIPSKDLEVITFDVQNADCFLIKTPQNKYFIIDTGRAAFRGGKAQANSIIIKYLKDKGIKNIEGMIITHFDNDHSGGAVDIMKNVKVKTVYVNSFDDDSNTSKSIYKTVRKLNLEAKIPKNNDEIYSENDLSLKTYMTDLDKDNEKSIITLLSYGDFDMLFTGDAGIQAFDNLKSYIPHNVEVLKVGHHGGSNVVNSEMLAHLNNSVSIISTGPNAFGHPSKGTLDILRETEIYRTDRHNSIKISSDGYNYDVYLYKPDKHKYLLSKNFKSIH